MHEDDIEKTAFITPFGLYEFLVIHLDWPYILKTFQRLMNYILQNYLGNFVAVYLNDVIIYTRGGYESHIDHLRPVFKMLRNAGLQIKEVLFLLSKYSLLRTCCWMRWNSGRL
jgi:hypothetical protein